MLPASHCTHKPRYQRRSCLAVRQSGGGLASVSHDGISPARALVIGPKSRTRGLLSGFLIAFDLTGSGMLVAGFLFALTVCLTWPEWQPWQFEADVSAPVKQVRS